MKVCNTSTDCRYRRGAEQVMVVSLTRMLKSFGQAQDDLPTLAANNAQEMGVNHNLNDNSDNSISIIIMTALNQITSVLH